MLATECKCDRSQLPSRIDSLRPQHTWTVTQQTLKSRSHNTPWLGQQVNGRVVKIWL
nr:hypothetical protein [Chroococcidiopsis sp. SAG 2025]